MIAQVAVEGGGGRLGGNATVATKVAKPQIFDRILSKVSGFVRACKMYIKMRLRETSVEEQVNWILTYVQGRAADIWKENMIEELEMGEIEFESAGKFLAEIKREFGEGDKELVKVAELKKIEQGERMMKEFVQNFKKIARGSGYKGHPLIEVFK